MKTLADRLNYAETPRPFRNPNFISRLNLRTASASSSAVKKNVKQILTLERERVSGGDGFLTAAQTAAKARGEVIEIGSKKKKVGTGLGAIGAKKGNILNIKGKRSVLGEGGSGATTPVEEVEDEDEGESEAMKVDGEVEAGDGTPRKEVITCQCIKP